MNLDDLLKKAARDYLGGLEASQAPKERIELFSEELARLEAEEAAGVVRPRRVLLVGGAGYIGSVLSRRLLELGWGVRVLDALIYGNGASLSGLVDDPGFSFIRGNFLEPAVADAALEGISDVVLLASLVGDPICKKYPELAKRVNLTGSQELFSRLHGRTINKFVFLSTCSNYGLREDDSLADENSELNPVSLYAETKVAFEKFVLKELPGIDFCPTLLRVATAYGASPRMRFDLTVNEFTRELALMRELLVYDQDTWRPYCHVQDISNIIIKVLTAPKAKVRGQVFNVGATSENFTKRMLVDEILKHLPQSKVEYKTGGFDPRNYRVAFDKVQKTLGFANQMSVPAFVPRLIAAVQGGVFAEAETRDSFHGNYEVREITQD